MVAQLTQLTYRCPKCGGTFVADGEVSVAGGCPSCRETPGSGWYLKVRGEVVGPVPFESLPQQINASAVLVRQAGEADWTPVTSVLPAMSPGASRSESPRAEEKSEFEAPPPPSPRRLLWPMAAVACAIVMLAGGWVYHRATLDRAVEAQGTSGVSTLERRGAPQDRREKPRPHSGESGQRADQLEKRLSDVDYRRQLLIEVAARQERTLAAQMQELKASLQSRRFRRFRGYDRPDDGAGRTLMTGFRRRLALAWAVTLAKRQDAAAEQSFFAAEVKRLSGAAPKRPLQPHDEQLLKQNGVKYRTQYHAFYTSAHKELTLYMDYATAAEIVQFAAHCDLSFPPGALPADFAAAVEKLRSRQVPGSWGDGVMGTISIRVFPTPHLPTTPSPR